MAIKKVFYDEDNNYELNAYENVDGKIFIDISAIGDEYRSGYLTLQKWELKELIEHLITLLDDEN